MRIMKRGLILVAVGRRTLTTGGTATASSFSSITRTRVPGSMVVTSGGATIRPWPSDSERSTPELCEPVARAR